MASKHIGAKGLKAKVMREEEAKGHSPAEAARMAGGAVHNSYAKASAKAKRANPRLRRVKPAKKGGY